MLVLGIGASKRASPRPAPSAAESADNKARLWLQNLSWDDSAREYVFRAAVRKAGQRCDKVSSQIMGAPGEWTVVCTPGYRYLFKFDEKGDLVKAVRAQ